MANIGSGRPLRVCDECGIVDDHPRHSFAGAPGGTPWPAPSVELVRKVMDQVKDLPREDQDRIVNDLLDGTVLDLHMDCCRERGCPLPADDPLNCANKTRGAEVKRGKALLAYLTREQ